MCPAFLDLSWSFYSTLPSFFTEQHSSLEDRTSCLYFLSSILISNLLLVPIVTFASTITFSYQSQRASSLTTNFENHSTVRKVICPTSYWVFDTLPYPGTLSRVTSSPIWLSVPRIRLRWLHLHLRNST